MDWFAILFGLFLGLTILKFGNPVVLESKVGAPKNFDELWTFAWPLSWSVWFLIPLAIIGAWLGFSQKPRWPASRWLWILPLVWFGWQLISATRTVDATLTWITVRHFTGVIVCYFTGVFVLGNDRAIRLLLIGLLAAFAFCLVRAANQKLVEFPQEYRFLVENQNSGWTNLPPETFLQMKHQGTVITTNGMDVANQVILKKYEKGRAFGTLVYPNALAGIILLLLPVSLVLAVNGTRRFRIATRVVAIGLTLFLGFGALLWTGSKSGWLIALGLAGVCLFRLPWSSRTKWITLALIAVLGLGAFGLRFKSYFASGATSVGARFDYWQAAVQTTIRKPIFGSGPGTFQHPYFELKSPEAEMARLTHNDYLEQFSDSGLVGGLSYFAWLAGLLAVLGLQAWKSSSTFYFALFLGCLGWFMQGVSEFGLYIPALAWTAFALAGSLLKSGQSCVPRPSDIQ